MYKVIKKPEIPTSSPDRITFPFEFSTFQYTMENFVKSFTRNRVTKEYLVEVMEEINAALKSESDSFKIWDHLAIALLVAIDGGILACILTLKIKYLLIFAIKLGVIFVGIILNFVIYSCCLGGTSTRMRDKVQGVLDNKDEYFDSKGMRWAICAETEFPYWLELHVQSQFEMKLQKEKEELEGKKRLSTKDQENQGIIDRDSAKIKKNKQKANMKGKEKKLINMDEEDEEYYQEEEVAQQPNKGREEVEINVKNDKKFDRLYAPLEEDYEENYEDEEV